MKPRNAKVDEHGQPLAPFPMLLIHNHGKAVDQLIGMCRGILCDDEINDKEAAAFRRLVDILYHEQPIFPFNDLKARLDLAFYSGPLNKKSRTALAAIMKQFAGLGSDGESGEATTLPLDPEPGLIDFEGWEFVVTGRCLLGTRDKVHEAIQSKGGTVVDHPREETRYLVIGHFASRDWAYTTYGRKIERAVELRKRGTGLKIIGESYFTKYL